MNKTSPLPPEKQRFFRIFTESKLTQKEFAGRLGKSQNQISAILNNRSNISGDMIQLLKYKFNVNPDFILHGRKPVYLKPHVDGSAIPLLHTVPSGDSTAWPETQLKDYADEFIAIPGMLQENLFAVRVRDDSMEPRLRSGDILVIDPHVPYRNGIALVLHENQYIIRTVRKAADKWFCVPLNEKYEITEISETSDPRFFVPVAHLSIQYFET